MTDKELKPCPNCGGQPKIHKTHKKFYVECDGDCWTQTGKHWYQEDAVKEWNTQIAVAKEGRQMTDHNNTPKLKIRVNPNEATVKAVREALEETGGYCPCALFKTDDTKCMCKDFREQIANGIPGKCHCGLYEGVLEE